MMTIERHVGRLCEAVLTSPVTVAEAMSFAQSMRSVLLGVGRPALICADLRGVVVFPPDVAESLTNLMKEDNHRIERSAHLINDRSVFGLQIERMMRDAGNANRRAFRARAPLEKWLTEGMTPIETARLAKFLDEGPRAA